MSASGGSFITVEGGEGCGKSTLIKGLLAALQAEGRSVITTREPGGTPLAESVRTLVLSPPEGDAWTPLAEALLMNAARSDHVEKKIRPALERGDWVLCDRFSDSTLVYQGVGGVSRDILLAMQSEVTARTRPDMTFILDAPPEAMLSRRTARGTSDAFERRPIEFHRKVREAFLDIARNDPGRCVVLNAELAPEALVDAALKAVRERLVPA
ncbi:MAG: dTMP kinase [Henriciella sp.]|uniref:dTMP kinase n=1 Tax=Henriciella sp. TaxID=1968823 RepID=UPI0032EE1A26